MAHRLDTETAAREAALALQRQGRRRPAAVVSIAFGQHEPYVDVEEVERAVGDLCDVFVLPTGPASWAFAASLPEGRQVYGGASRVYSTDLAWLGDQHHSPLRFAYGRADRERATEQLITDALTAVHAGASLQSPQEARGLPRSGVVMGTAGSRAFVRLDDGGTMPAVIHPELVTAGVPAERMFAKGQRVTGLYDPRSNRLDVSGSVAPVAEALAHVPVGEVLLAQVAAVGPKGTRVALLPGLEVTLSADDLGVGADDDASGLATVGEVLPVEVAHCTDGIPDRVALLDPEFAEVALPVAIFAGGPPWLVQGAPSPPEHAAAEAAAAGASQAHAAPGAASRPGAAALAELEAANPQAAALLSDNAALLGRVADMEERVSRLERELAAARTSAREARQQARKASKELESSRSERARVTSGLFADPVEQFRHEVYVAWAERTTADDKRTHHWREFTVGANFLATLDELKGVDRAKVAEVVADIVSGRVEQMNARAMHVLRTGPGAHDPAVSRAQGETCWRVSLQHKTASARRLHFWRLTDGSVELSSVRLHDDMRP